MDKTKIVYCQDENRKGNYENTSFDFLGYTFRKRATKWLDKITTEKSNKFVHWKFGATPTAR